MQYMKTDEVAFYMYTAEEVYWDDIFTAISIDHSEVKIFLRPIAG